MAGTLLHITLAHKALDAASLSLREEEVIRTHIHDFRLGSVLVDIPYYDRLWITGLRVIAGKDIHYADWGAKMHTSSPTALALALLDAAKTPAEQALAIGFLTHIAVDVIFHAEIERRVSAQTGGKVGPEQAHKFIEDQIDLHVHNDILGHPGIGNPYIRRMLSLRPGSSWADITVAALKEAHGTVNSPGKFRTCLRALAIFGYIYSASHAPWIKTTPSHDPDLKQAALSLATQSIELAARYMEAGAAYSSGKINREDFEKAVPPRSLANGGELSS